MKKSETYFEQVPRAIAEKVLARQTGLLEPDVAQSGETVKPKVGAAAPALRSPKV